MNKKLTEEEQLAWDRLIKGIPAPPNYSNLEEEIARIMAEELRKEIDAGIVKLLADA